MRARKCCCAVGCSVDRSRLPGGALIRAKATAPPRATIAMTSPTTDRMRLFMGGGWVGERAAIVHETSSSADGRVVIAETTG